MNKLKAWLPMIGLVTLVLLVAGNIIFALVQRQQIAAQSEARQLVTQQAMEQEAARQAAENEKIAAEAAERIAQTPEIVPLPTPKPTPKPSPKPQENDTVTEPDGDMTVKQPEYTKPTPPPAPDPGQPAEPTPTPKPKPSQPKDGTERINSDGVLEIYVGGFGWITSGGPNETIPGDFELTGDIVGF